MHEVGDSLHTGPSGEPGPRGTYLCHVGTGLSGAGHLCRVHGGITFAGRADTSFV